MLITKMAFRNIFRQRRRSILTGLSMFGGFVLAAFFIGWADGTYNRVIEDFTRHNYGHIQIHHHQYLDRPSIYKTIKNPAEIEEKLDHIKYIDGWAPRIYSAGLASVGEKSGGIRIIGVDPLKESETTGFHKRIVRGESLPADARRGILLGTGLAKLLKADVSGDLVIVTQGADGSLANDRYTILGILDCGDEISNRMNLYMHLEDAQELLVLGNRIHEIAVTVSGLKRIPAVNDNITAALQNPQLSVEPWQVFAQSFYKAMSADMEGMYMTLLIIVLVVAVGVLNTVLMMVLERRREYGVLKALGTKPRQIIKLIFTEVTFLAVISIVVGSVVGFLLNLYLSRNGIHLSEPFLVGGMEFDAFYSEINIRSFTIPIMTVLFSAFGVSLFPAILAARTRPAKIMRMH